MRILLVMGTRPEAIKLAPVYFALQEVGLSPLVCATFQHRELLSDVLDFFGINVDFALDVMRPAQPLSILTTRLLSGIFKIILKADPQIVVVQGDTATTFAAGLAAFYQKVPVAHVEAGLRSYNPVSPFPEEMNRRAVALMAELHYAPTPQAVENLIKESVAREKIFFVGNTVVDALNWAQQRVLDGWCKIDDRLKQLVGSGKRLIILTLHRREATFDALKAVCDRIRYFVLCHDDVVVLHARHPNPAVAGLSVCFDGCDRIVSVPPVSYPEMLFLLQHAAFVVTDSGGISEEAVTIGKRVICVRRETDRPEGVLAGLVTLVGFDPARLDTELESCYRTGTEKNGAPSPFGDGKAAARIAKTIKDRLMKKRADRL